MADMRAAAVTARLKQASELASLCLKLSRAMPHPPQPAPGRERHQPAVAREGPTTRGGDE